MSDTFPLADIERPIPHRLEVFARRYPDRVAVRGYRWHATYRQIDDRANVIANALIALCGATAEVVAVLLNKDSAELVPAFFGVLKAGHIHIALDPLSVPEQNRQVLADCGARILLTDSIRTRTAESVATKHCRIICVEDIDGSGLDSPPSVAIASDAPALLIYTSGSTGRPKGVLWNHRNFLYCVRVMTVTMAVDADDRVALLATMCVFAGPRDTLAALLNGASLSLFDLGARGVGELGAWLHHESITYVNMVATVFRHFAATLAPGDRFPSMRVLRCSAEALTANDLNVFDRYFEQHCRLRVGFAITETGNVTQALLHHNTPLESAAWGQTLDGMEILILDERGRELACNEIGELAVRSRFLSCGYWGQPELTRQVFLPDPSGGDRRTYLTGDLARLRSDGALEYHGRRDRMVKVRATKVFLDVVEREMLRVPGVKQAAAIVRMDPSENTQLIGYVAGSLPQGMATQIIREKLAAVLPPTSVPSLIIELPSLPSTPQGKLDRRALPEPNWQDTPESAKKVDPRTPVERLIAGIWTEVLNLSRLDITDRFIEIGGDSLQAGRIVARVNSTFDLNISLRYLLESPTVEEMAIVVTKALLEQADFEKTAIGRDDIDG